MIRRVVEQTYHSIDYEPLARITVFEPGVNKEQIKAKNIFRKRHDVLVENGGKFDFK